MGLILLTALSIIYFSFQNFGKEFLKFEARVTVKEGTTQEFLLDFELNM